MAAGEYAKPCALYPPKLARIYRSLNLSCFCGTRCIGFRVQVLKTFHPRSESLDCIWKHVVKGEEKCQGQAVEDQILCLQGSQTIWEGNSVSSERTKITRTPPIKSCLSAVLLCMDETLHYLFIPYHGKYIVHTQRRYIITPCS